MEAYVASKILSASNINSALVISNNLTVISNLTINGSINLSNSLTVSNLTLSVPRWDDAPVIFTWPATGPSVPPTTAVTNGSIIYGIGFTTAGISNQIIYGAAQISHRIANSNDTLYIEPHIHVSPVSAPGAGSSNVHFRIVYDLANIGGSRYGPKTNSVQIGLTGNTYNNLIDMGHVYYTNFNPGISAIFRCSIQRLNAYSNEYNATIILDAADVHFPADKFGSSTDSAP